MRKDAEIRSQSGPLRMPLVLGAQSAGRTTCHCSPSCIATPRNGAVGGTLLSIGWRGSLEVRSSSTTEEPHTAIVHPLLVRLPDG